MTRAKRVIVVVGGLHWVIVRVMMMRRWQAGRAAAVLTAAIRSSTMCVHAKEGCEREGCMLYTHTHTHARTHSAPRLAAPCD